MGKIEDSHESMDPTADPCNIVINTIHDSGCIVYTSPQFVQFLVDYSIITGTACVLLGLGIAFAG